MKTMAAKKAQKKANCIETGYMQFESDVGKSKVGKFHAARTEVGKFRFNLKRSYRNWKVFIAVLHY